MGQEGIPRGLKPHSLAILSAWAKAQAYLKSKSKNNGKSWLGKLFIPTLGAIKPRLRWGTRAVLAG